MNVVGTLRDATADDAEAILDLALLSDIAEVGEPNTTIDEIRSDIANSFLRAAVVEGADSHLLGYAWMEQMPNHSNMWGDMILRPGREAEVIPVLFDWLLEQKRTVEPVLPIHVFANAKNRLKRQTYEQAGGTIIRRFYRMHIMLDEAPPAPTIPPGVVIRPITDDEADLRAMYEVVDVAFRDHFDPVHETYDYWLARSVQGSCPDLSLWWLVTVDGEPAAGLYAAEMPEAGYVDTLGTLRAYRGKGIGKAVLLTAFAEFYRRGFPKVALGVDATSPTGAVALYESVGMSVAHEGLRYELL